MLLLYLIYALELQYRLFNFPNVFIHFLRPFLYQGKLDPVIGRTNEIERVTQVLCKRRKNNVCLTGDPGVGKTVIVDGLAQRVANASIPLKLQGKKVTSYYHGRHVILCYC